MNLYFLVEGTSELRVYPKLIEYFLPNLSRVKYANDATENNYYLITGRGYPSILDNYLADSIDDINSCGNYDILILAIDADLLSVQDKIAEVNSFIRKNKLKLHNCSLEIVVQNRCIETWFLGNRKVYSRNPTNLEFIEFTKFYDVSENDPELMRKPSDFNGELVDYHYKYLKRMLREKNISYSKTKPNEVGKPYYIEELKKRIQETPNHLASLKNFFDFCNSKNV